MIGCNDDLYSTVWVAFLLNCLSVEIRNINILNIMKSNRIGSRTVSDSLNSRISREALLIMYTQRDFRSSFYFQCIKNDLLFQIYEYD